MMKVTIEFDQNDPRSEVWLKRLRKAAARQQTSSRWTWDPFELLHRLINSALTALVKLIRRWVEAVVKPRDK